jgi:flagellar biosynthesis/type III secretory pathway protein FliH
MEEVIGAYRQVTATDEFKELERLRERARHNEASALRHARNQGKLEGEQQEREKWQSVLTEKDELIAQLQAQLEQKN